MSKKSGSIVVITHEHDASCTVRRIDTGKEMLMARESLVPLKQIWVTDDADESPVQVPAGIALPAHLPPGSELDVMTQWLDRTRVSYEYSTVGPVPVPSQPADATHFVSANGVTHFFDKRGRNVGHYHDQLRAFFRRSG